MKRHECNRCDRRRAEHKHFGHPPALIRSPYLLREPADPQQARREQQHALGGNPRLRRERRRQGDSCALHELVPPAGFGEPAGRKKSHAREAEQRGCDIKKLPLLKTSRQKNNHQRSDHHHDQPLGPALRRAAEERREQSDRAAQNRTRLHKNTREISFQKKVHLDWLFRCAIVAAIRSLYKGSSAVKCKLTPPRRSCVSRFHKRFFPGTASAFFQTS